jgi:endonuclease/exonuclease/phosphatase (EEP) superfamily protein YafD
MGWKRYNFRQDFIKKITAVGKKNYVLRYTAEEPTKQIYTNTEVCLGAPLPTGDLLSVMVWNIFKQQRADWLTVLKSYAEESQLMLLQEAQTTPELVKFATSHYMVADQVPAISLPNRSNRSSGVMTLSAAHPVYCCPLRKPEPFLRFPKSALITVYPLVDARLLMVVNIHSINFSLGVDIYHQQLKAIGEHVSTHDGPVIFAGDFNTWSRKRLHLLYQFSRLMRLQEVRFRNDHRIKAFGLPLDFIFYRGLKVSEAVVINTQASDHNPLFVQFDLTK